MKKTTVADTPELMYQDFKHRKIKELTSSQGQIVYAYTENLNKKDIALELPTGSGKTLVGLVIGEWRRAKNQEKVVFLCPTRQLVNQVKKQTEEKYGIPVTAYTGSIKNYTDEQKGNWQLNKTIAVTTYSSFFNTNTFFDGADVCIFDDSHSAENYIAKMWTLEIDKNEDEGLFNSFVSILKNHVTHSDYLRLINEEYSDDWVEKIPTPTLNVLRSDIISCVDQYIASTDSSVKYSWSMIRDHLLACNLFISPTKMIIRPLIPPTLTYSQFKDLKQRIYMSATLGNGGELERIVGVKNIFRIPSPDIWKTRAVGRRLIFFPELGYSEKKYEIAASLINYAGRALLMTSSEASADDFKSEVENRLNAGFSFVSASDFERDPDSFYKNDKRVLCFANRYEGLDLKGDSCRLLIMDSISKMLSLQDKFLFEKLQSKSVFIDRITTRLTQAIGRCTRSENDHSLAFILGDKLTDLYLDKRYRDYLNPEIQGEIKFGSEESSHEDNTQDSFLDNFKVFLGQGDNWQGADEVIIDYRDKSIKKSIPGEKDLENSVVHEIDCVYNLWKENYKDALDNAKSVIGCLKDSNLQGFRTFWNYYAGVVDYLWSIEKEEVPTDAVSYFEIAAKSSVTVKWFAKLANKVSKGTIEIHDNTVEIEQFDNMQSLFLKDGLVHNGKFDKREQRVRSYLISGDSSKFEESVVELGKLLGFTSGKVEEEGSPDPYWLLNDNQIIVFEANNEASEESVLSTTKARQAATHDNWLKANLELDDTVKIHQVLITPKVKFSDGAISQIIGSGLSLWTLNEFVEWANNALTVVREVRKSCSTQNLLAKPECLELIEKNCLSSKKLLEHLTELKMKK
jgi:hypothetical protein